jgi:hypothetical protein
MRSRYLLLVFLLNSCCPHIEGSSSFVSADKSKTNRASICEGFRRVYRDDEWNEVTETYPQNIAWNECMGVALVPKRTVNRAR